MAQLVKNLPAMQETWVPSPAWEDSEEGNGYPLQYAGLESSMDYITHSSMQAWRVPWTIYPWGCKESDMTE